MFGLDSIDDLDVHVTLTDKCNEKIFDLNFTTVELHLSMDIYADRFSIDALDIEVSGVGDIRLTNDPIFIW